MNNVEDYNLLKKKKGKTNIIVILVISLIIVTVLLLILLLKKDNVNDLNEIEFTETDAQEITEYFEKKYNPKTEMIVNNDSDYRLDGGLKLDNKENVKLVTDAISQLIMYRNINEITLTHLLAMLSIGDTSENFNIHSGFCFRKDYLVSKSNEYFYDTTIDFNNLDGNLTNYYCSTGLGNFGGVRPTYDSTVEIDNGLKLTYKLLNPQTGNTDEYITFTYILKDNMYKLKSIESYNQTNNEDSIN